MTKILAPNKNFTGIQASVKFINGVGETNSPYLIDYFKRKGYTIKQDAKKDNEANNISQAKETKEEEKPVKKTTQKKSIVKKKPTSPKSKTKKSK